MTVQELIKYLSQMPLDATINVLIETVGENACQYEFSANGLAYSKSGNTVIIMHEKWGVK